MLRLPCNTETDIRLSVQLAKLICATSRQLFSNRTRSLVIQRCVIITLHIEWNNVLGVVFCDVLSLLISEPAGLDETHPAIVAKDCTNEGFHIFGDDSVCAHISLDL